MTTLLVQHTDRTTSPRMRVFVRDLAALFQQQMYFWGCDAKVDRNLLNRLGGERIAREVSCGEGSSRYRWRWHSGTVELHSFCAGWYPDDESAAGIVYIRGYKRFFDCKGGEPVEPGKYFESRFLYANNVEIQALLRPLLTWLVEYERRVELEKGVAYRARCYRLYRRQKHSKPWLHVRAAEPMAVALEAVRAFVAAHGISALNVAGSRGSKEPEVGAFVRKVLSGALLNQFVHYADGEERLHPADGGPPPDNLLTG